MVGETLTNPRSSICLVASIASANTARHVEELVAAAGFPALYGHIADRAAAACHSHARGALDVEVILFDGEGRVLGRASKKAEDRRQGADDR